VILTGVNGNVIMSGCRDADPDDARREALAAISHQEFKTN
jgi:hypothetical protein